MPTGPEIILTLKVLVSAVTVLLTVSMAALASGYPRLHGRLNMAFFALTMLTVFGFEGLLRFGGVDVSAGFSEATQQALKVHLCFAVPAAALLPVMLLTGVRRRRTVHTSFGMLFLILWAGTFVTGLFYLPHG